MDALSTLAVALERGVSLRHICCMGLPGSGKTAVYLGGDAEGVGVRGKSSLMLVPEIGLTPAMTGQMVAAFGNRGGASALRN